MTPSDMHDESTAAAVDCDALFERLDLLLDRELPQDELDRLETHLAACLPCAGRRDFEAQLRAVVRERCADQAPADLVARIRDRLELPTR